ncbi:MAG: hypothetical protein WDN28_31750 [Chthoniobacter sp.]
MLHIIAVAVIYFVSSCQRKAPPDQVMWLEGGSGGAEAKPAPVNPPLKPPPAPPEPETRPEPLAGAPV